MNTLETGVIIVDHGSRRAEANVMLEEIARRYRERTGERIVEHAHMELAAPTIAEAFARCVAQRAAQVVVALYFLSPGRHSARDIPALVSRAAALFPDVPYRITDPLGVDGHLIDLLHARVQETANSPAIRMIGEDPTTKN